MKIINRLNIFFHKNSRRTIERKIQEKIKNNHQVLGNFGCGARYHPEWINIDFYPGGNIFSWDLNKGIPITDNCCDVVYSSHLLEHFNRSSAIFFLNECYRVLKPGGIIRIVVPDLESITREYLTQLNNAYKGERNSDSQYEWIVIELLDQLVRHESGGEMQKYWCQNEVPEEDFIISRVGKEYLLARKHLKITERNKNKKYTPRKVGNFRLSGEVHQWMYDRYSLKKILLNCCFSEIKPCDPYSSNIKGFLQYCLDTDNDGTIYKPDSIYMEGKKIG